MFSNNRRSNSPDDSRLDIPRDFSYDRITRHLPEKPNGSTSLLARFPTSQTTPVYRSPLLQFAVFGLRSSISFELFAAGSSVVGVQASNVIQGRISP